LSEDEVKWLKRLWNRSKALSGRVSGVGEIGWVRGDMAQDVIEVDDAVAAYC